MSKKSSDLVDPDQDQQKQITDQRTGRSLINKEPSKTELITNDYASTLVHELLSTDDSVSIFNAIKKLKFYDTRFKQMGLRATIKVGTEKIG